MSCETILAELDREQRRAATAETNAVVAAGAGSGKTKVLAARYAWLVMEKKIPVDQILTLTFTNKAVSEMYSRIYGLLGAERDNPEARRGIANFHQARISTLDAFCGQVARSAARRYGLGPGFTSDEAGVRELAMEASLPFVLEHRENPSLQLLLSSKKIKTVAEELFAETVLRHSPLSKPLDFSAFIKIQNDELLREWRVKSAAAAELAGLIKAELEGAAKKSGAVYENLQRALQKPLPPAPDLEPLLGEGRETGELRKEITAYFECINRLKSVSLRGKAPEGLAGAVEGIKTLRDPLSGELESIANMALQSGIARAVFPLVEEFQNRFNRKKREAGILTFNDIAHLAVDALSRYPDIRQVYKDAYRAIMIDEFQDNNGLQRDLIFLLAEKPERRDRGVPGPGELSPDKMFFVGDEKQSIYRFRGADVSVFRRLARDLAGGGAEGSGGLSLVHNYRSRPILIEAFNRIFGGSGPGQPGLSPQPGVFLPEGPELADFEAAYSRLRSPGELGAEDLKNPPVHFCFLDRGGLAKEAPPGGRGLEAEELEAAFIAGKIREMVEGAYPVPVREKGETGVRPCGYGDFAILERSYRRQGTLEKQCKLFGVPFNADRPAGLFNDAPINDLYHLLRLLAYPQDRLSYAALIRSPFTRLGDLTLTVCMLNHRDPETGLPRRPFDEALDGIVPPEERERYREARRRFEALVEAARTLSLTGLLTKLWFDEGCRYETLWSAPAQVYGELFDLFFEIARQCAEGGKALPDFIDYLAGLISQEERAGDLEVPAEEETGVRIMSVHKSKGLEFPVVFVYGSGGRGAKQTNTESFFFSEQWGITLNLPPAEELGGGGGNYFFTRQRELERAKAEAELRRLLYVAMTRAEAALFITASLPEQTQGEREEADPADAKGPEDFIRTRLAQLGAKGTGGPQSFLDLLLPALNSRENPPFSIEAIPVLSREELRRRAGSAGNRQAAGTAAAMLAAAERAAPLYAGAEAVPPPPEAAAPVPASSLRYTGPVSAALEAAPAAASAEDAALDRLLKQSGLDSAEFGSIAHGFIEARFRNRPPGIPPRLLAKAAEGRWDALGARAQAMADRFFASELGRLSLAAPYREAEFPVLTFWGDKGAPLPISGQIDLLFESAGTMHVADFKTDRAEAPAEHLAQLAVYGRAVADIFGKPVRCWLFYLRSGRAVELTASLDRVDIEQLVLREASGKTDKTFPESRGANFDTN